MAETTIFPSQENDLSDEVKPPAVLEEITDEQIAGLTRLTMRLYCLPYSEEFRQPVQLKYPELVETYLSVIRTPSDLGTILLNLKHKKYKNINDCAKDLRLCFQNAIQFNADLSNLVSISNHLLRFTENLWHSIMQTPFNKSSKKTSSTSDNILFRHQIAKNCRLHYEETSNMSMISDEIQYLLERMESVTTNASDHHFSDAFTAVLKNCRASLNFAVSDDEITKYPSLADLISPLVGVVKAKFPPKVTQSIDVDNSTENDTATEAQLMYPCFMTSAFSDEKTFPEALALQNSGPMRCFERILGEVTAILFERLTRGLDMSAIWITYSRVVWAQPNTGQPSKSHGSKRGAWWPAMIIAGAGVSRTQEDINVSRIPKPIKTALNKLRPKSKDCASLNGGYVGTDQLCLVEYFGTHDFGWCKTEMMESYCRGEKFHLSEEKKESGYSDKVTGDAYAIEEAEGSFEYMEGALTACNYKPEDGFLSDLEESIDNLPVHIQYLLPGQSSTESSSESKKRHPKGSGSGTANGSVKSTKGNKRNKKKSLYSQLDKSAPFTFTMYPSEHEDLLVPGNKRQFALLKAASLCHYAQTMNKLTVPQGRGRGGGAGGLTGSSDLSGTAATAGSAHKTYVEPNAASLSKLSAAEAEALRRNMAIDEENAAAGMCFTGINTNKVPDGETGSGKMSSANGKKQGVAKAGTDSKDGVGGDGVEHEKREYSKYTPKVLSYAGQTFAASIGCTQVVRNKTLSFVTVLHTRKIDHDNPIFFLEDSSCETRKELLRKEITRMKGELENMSDWLAFADTINAKRQQEKLQRQEMARAGGDSLTDLNSIASDDRREKTGGGFKKGLLQSGRAADGAGAKPKRKYVRKEVKTDGETGSAVGVSRGKAQQEEALNSNNATIMSSSYSSDSLHHGNGTKHSQKRRRSSSSGDDDASGEGDDGAVAKPAKVARGVVKPEIPKPFGGFTSVMNMMPSLPTNDGS